MAIRPGQEGLTDDANSIIKAQQGLAEQTPDQIAQNTLQGTEKSQVLQDNAISDAKDTAMGSSTPSFVREALQRRSQKQFENIGLQNKNKAKMDSAGRLASQQNVSFQAQAHKEAIADEAYKRDLMDQSNRRAARNAIISSITGGLGAVGGLLASGGNPKGAQLGAKAGSSMAGDSTQSTMAGSIG